MARKVRKWLIYYEEPRNNRYRPFRRIYFRFDSLNGVVDFVERHHPRTATVYDSKQDAETAVLLFAGKHPEWIGRMKVTHTKR